MRGLALAVAVSIVCVCLGHWQWQRRQARLARNAPLVQNYDATPSDVFSVLPADGSDVAADDAWTPVRVDGSYDAAATVLVRNRPQNEQTGYEVLVPLVLGDGTALLIDRGWLPAGDATDVPDEVPAPPVGRVEVVARVKPWEEARRATAPEGQVSSIAGVAVARQTSRAGAPRLLGGYAVLADETPTPAVRPIVLARPEVDEGPHLAYTIQWYGFALTALVVWVVAGRRELESRRVGLQESGDGAVLDDGLSDTGLSDTGLSDNGLSDNGLSDNGPEDSVGADRSGTLPAQVGADASAPTVGPRFTRRGRPRRPGADEDAEDAEVEALHLN
ncbi:MAG: SURF1 family cytochrome oxidase biogenesis protein [Janthinobacterium lividum]